jgi:hypothetical protein
MNMNSYVCLKTSTLYHDNGDTFVCIFERGICIISEEEWRMMESIVQSNKELREHIKVYTDVLPESVSLLKQIQDTHVLNDLRYYIDELKYQNEQVAEQTAILRHIS